MIGIRIAFTGVAALSLSGCIMLGEFGPSDRYQADFHYTWDVRPDAEVDAESFNGSIEIAGWDENKVEITGTKYAATESMLDAIRIETHNSPSMVEIRALRPSQRMGNPGARYVIRVPKTARIERITTSNAHIRVHDVANAAHLKTSNGGIRAENVGGSVEARTSNSSIDMDSIGGSAVMKTSNGRIHAENIDGDCDADTSNSSITVRLTKAPASPMRFVTSNGSIDLTMLHAPKNDIQAKTSNSSITLRLPGSTSARLMADTSHSNISSDFDIRTDYHGDREKNHLDGMIGSGGPRIDVSTSNGHIRLVRGGSDSE